MAQLCKTIKEVMKVWMERNTSRSPSSILKSYVLNFIGTAHFYS